MPWTTAVVHAYAHFIFMKECDIRMFPNSLRYLSFTSFMRNLENVHLRNSCIAPEKLQLQTIAKQKSTLWRVADVFRQTSLTNVPNNHYETIIYYRKIFSSFHLEICSILFPIALTYCEKKLFQRPRTNLLEFEVEDREFSKILWSLEQVIQSVKGQYNFWNRMLF